MLQVWFILGCVCLSLVVAFDPNNLSKCFKVQEQSCHNISYYHHNTFTQALVNRVPLINGKIAVKWENLKPIKVLIHGFGGNRLTTPNEELLPVFLRNPDVDVLSIDYSIMVQRPCYMESVHNARIVGRCLGEFLASLALNDCGKMSVDLHLIGLGIGAHVAGFAGQQFQKLKAQKVQRITALDPGKTLYMTRKLEERLDASDAKFVDVIHTDIMLHGLLQPIGHVDFFPNKGLMQPNCGSIREYDTHACYHKRAAEYFAESIESKDGFWAFKCPDLYSFIQNLCKPEILVELGHRANPAARGNYFLGTNELPPYARGKNFENLDRSVHNKTFLSDKTIDNLQRMGRNLRNLTLFI